MSLRRIIFRPGNSPLPRISNLHRPHPRLHSTKPPSSKPPTTNTPPSSNPNPKTHTHTNPTTSTSQTSTKTTTTHHDRLTRLLSRLPKFLHPYTSGLLHAPLTHITSFLLLHELTAIIPLIGFACWFHWGNGLNYLPSFVASDRYIPEYIEKFGRYFRRKGWFGFGRGGEGGDGKGGEVVVSEGGEVVVREGGEGRVRGMGMGKRERIWMVGEKGSRILVEVATAYAITKLLLPVRVVVSLWATPWFARVVLGVFGRLRKGKGGGSVK